MGSFVNQRVFVLLLVLFFGATPGLAAAATSSSRSIHVEWGYTPPSEPQVTGFRLYQEGVQACQTTSATATAMDCTVTLVKAVTNFTLTATFADNSESPHSAPFAFSPDDGTAPSQTVATTTLPTAVLSTSTAAGTSPLRVSFDGSKSTAASGSTLSSYQWQFGDDSSASGSTATHVYHQAGTYTATLTVTDSTGVRNVASTPIVVTPPASASKQAAKAATTTTAASLTATTATATTTTTTTIAANTTTATSATAAPASASSSLRLEAGEISVASGWRKVIFAHPYQQPIVVTGPVGMNDQAPVTVRLRNVTTTGFEIRLIPWPSQDTAHGTESVSYLVMEQGRHILADGSRVEAGSLSGSTGLSTVALHSSFTRTPVLLTAIASCNDAEAISGRVLPVAKTGFLYTFREQERNLATGHPRETVHYVAWEPGTGLIGTARYEAAVTTQTITSAWNSVPLQSTFKQAPLLFADMQSLAELDPATLRVRQTSSKRFQAMIQEERSLDRETTHRAERIGYLALDPLSLGQ